MRGEYAASLAAAIVCHALLLFGFKLEAPARPLPASDDASAVDVSLVPAPPEPPPVEATPAPEIIPPPEPPAPAPTPDESMPPAPAATPAPAIAPEPRSLPRPPAHPHPANTAPKPAASRGSVNRGSVASGAVGMAARYRSNPKPDYPPEAKRLRQQGVVLLKVEVGADGRAGGVSLERSSGFPLLDQAAIQAVKRWTFEPATVAGLPAASAVDVPIRFSLSE